MTALELWCWMSWMSWSDSVIGAFGVGTLAIVDEEVALGVGEAGVGDVVGDCADVSPDSAGEHAKSARANAVPHKIIDRRRVRFTWKRLGKDLP